MNAGEPANLRAWAVSSVSMIATVKGSFGNPMSSRAARSKSDASSEPGHSGITSSSTSTPASWLSYQSEATAHRQISDLSAAGLIVRFAAPTRSGFTGMSHSRGACASGIGAVGGVGVVGRLHDGYLWAWRRRHDSEPCGHARPERRGQFVGARADPFADGCSGPGPHRGY